MSVVSEICATPFTISSGARSPPMASTAIVGIGSLLARSGALPWLAGEARAEGALVDAVLEGFAAVHAEDGDFGAVLGGEFRVGVHVDVFRGEGDVAGDAVDHGVHFFAEVAVVAGVERHADR